jgi:sigma-B regulation protein RsbU (phosphoserine phosphatase)
VFITAILGRVEAATGAVEYVNAGHPAPVLLRGGQAIPVEAGHSLPLGVEPDETYPVQHIEPHRDLHGALLYTDGLVDATDAAGHMLDLPPVLEAITAGPPPTAQGVLDRALAVVHSHLGDAPNADDLTLLAVQFGS